MPSTISRWGNSLGIRLPKEALERARLCEGDAVSVEPIEGGLIVRPVDRANLGDLLAAITPENLHADILEAPRVGKELW